MALIPRVASRVVSLFIVAPKQNIFMLGERHCSRLFQKPLANVNGIVFRRYFGAQEQINLQELKDRTLNVVKLFDKINPEQVSLEAHFLNDLGLDSLDSVEIVMAFEDEFGVEISDDEAEKIFTCNDAIELLKVKLDIS